MKMQHSRPADVLGRRGMNAVLRVVLLLCVLIRPQVVAAQSYVPIEQRLSAEQLQSVGLTATQLEQLNRLLRQAHEQAPAPAAVAATAPVAPARSDTAGRDDAGRDRSSLVGFNDEPIRSRLKGTVGEWAPGTVFELENGQQWKVLKGHMTLKTPLDAPEIEVIPGVAGRWFLQVHEDYPKARVYRID